MMSPLDDLMTADDVRALAEIGFMALSHGRDRPAETLFRGVSAARPGGEAGVIGLALVALYRGHVDDAVAALRRLPPSDDVCLFLGMALIRANEKDEARRLLSDLIASSPGSSTAVGAAQLLDSL